MSVKKKILIGLPLILILLLVGAFLFIDQIAERAIEVGGEKAMGVPTSVDNLTLSPFEGRGSIEGLKISNPKGFETPFFMSLSRGEIFSTLGTIFTDTMVVKSIELDGLEAYLEKNQAGSNYRVILDNMKKGEEAPEPKEAGKNLRVQQVVLRNIQVHADIAVVGQIVTTAHVKIDEIRLEDVGSGVNTSKLMGIIVRAVLAAALEQGVKLPVEIAKDLGTSLPKVGAEVTIKVAGKAVKVLGGAVGDVLGGIFGGGDDD